MARLAAIGQLVRSRETGGKMTCETGCYLLSAPLTAQRFGDVARAHWGVENGLHWVLEVTMNSRMGRRIPDQIARRFRLRPNAIALRPAHPLANPCPGY
jgi:predicted transposase YbfD/YdcC